ncbi:glycosyltransferase family 2 protein [Novosphingobium mangrovi (ex Huang et al. 2023)]|uniref:Glycosyltransferase n=1 Tax=Novosphingobium mangrovi (ex Huang et al. 2023) TaxID=2976432 RepID=A0ABT2I9K8_9SPHN|nr:glycosyltransferase family A protein [Novosphingobium mangrovi (ex Huang et al. 2023)]MCT2401504.1 glycosyltransferase [Novosphingobium mangrovi (ex Huang et al. 2023)]
MSGAGTGDITVVIPSYNHAHFLAAAIDSVLNQTLLPAEIIVVDDGSRDDPGAVVEKYPSVRLIRHENKGLAAARNTGLDAARTAFLVFLDADDQLKPEALETGFDLLSQNPEAVFCYGAYVIVTKENGERGAAFRPVGADPFESFLTGNLVGMHATVMYRRSALAAIGGFRAGLPAAEDYDVYLRLSQTGPVLSDKRVLAEYWHHDANMSRNSGFMLSSVLSVLEAYRPAAEKAGLLAALEIGVAEWKHYYARVWAAQVKHAPFSPSVWKEGLVILQLAPKTVLKVIARRLKHLLRKR